MTGRSRLLGILYGVAGLAYGLDRLTKLLATDRLAERSPIVLVPGVLDLSYTTNSGGAFGLFGGQPWLFFGATIVVCAAIVALSPRVHLLWSSVGLGLILGGALGNITDRVLRGPGVSGHVVDFIHLHHWPTFNMADSCIVVGALVVGLAGVRRPRNDAASSSAPGDAAPEGAARED